MWKLLYKLVGFQRRLTDRWSSDHPDGKSKSLVSQWCSPSTFDDLGLNWSEFWGSPVALGHPIYVFLWYVVFAWFHGSISREWFLRGPTEIRIPGTEMSLCNAALYSAPAANIRRTPLFLETRWSENGAKHGENLPCKITDVWWFVD